MGQIPSPQIDIVEQRMSFKSPLNLFQTTVFPTPMFGLASLPLTQRSLHKLDVVQRQILGCIVGWVPIPDEPWDITMPRMNQRMEHTAALRPLPSWSKSNSVWQLRLLQISFPGLLRFSCSSISCSSILLKYFLPFAFSLRSVEVCLQRNAAFTGTN